WARPNGPTPCRRSSRPPATQALGPAEARARKKPVSGISKPHPRKFVIELAPPAKNRRYPLNDTDVRAMRAGAVALQPTPGYRLGLVSIAAAVIGFTAGLIAFLLYN